MANPFGTRATATATASGNATATVTGIAGSTFFVTDVSGSSDLAGATLQIKDGSTVIWQDRISNTSVAGYQFSTPLACTIGNNAVVAVTGTSFGAANIAGYFLTP
jgi:hypothetical protein